MGGEITTAHIAMIVAVLGLVVPVLTALALFALQRLTGNGDKAGAEIDELKEKVHALELAQVGQYATKADVDALRVDIVKRFETLTALLRPVFRQFNVNATFEP